MKQQRNRLISNSFYESEQIRLDRRKQISRMKEQSEDRVRKAFADRLDCDTRKIDVYSHQSDASSNLVTPTQYALTNQIKRSPSFRLKNYSNTRADMPGIKNDNFNRLNRINVLGNLVAQLDQEENKKQELRSTSDMATVPKQIQIKTQDSDQNLEELHFFLVQQQQKTTRLSVLMEGRNFH